MATASSANHDQSGEVRIAGSWERLGKSKMTRLTYSTRGNDRTKTTNTQEQRDGTMMANQLLLSSLLSVHVFTQSSDKLFALSFIPIHTHTIIAVLSHRKKTIMAERDTTSRDDHGPPTSKNALKKLLKKEAVEKKKTEKAVALRVSK